VIIFDLKCAGCAHVFEAWFGSSEEYENQKQRSLLSCPICGSSEIGKAVMAPAVPAKSNRLPDMHPGSAAPEAAPVPADEAKMKEVLTAIANAQAEMLKQSEWVGRDFAGTARAMHYGEQDAKPIHGEVAPKEARDLMEEGIQVAPLIVPFVPPKQRN
jgi:hypothetical protein